VSNLKCQKVNFFPAACHKTVNKTPAAKSQGQMFEPYQKLQTFFRDVRQYADAREQSIVTMVKRPVLINSDTIDR